MVRRRQAISILVEAHEHFTLLGVCDGVFVRDAAREMMAQIRKLKSDGKARFLLDFSTCAYISSEGLGLVSDLWRYCSETANGKLAVLLSSDPHNEMANLFETVGLLSVLRESLFADRRAAEAAFLPE